MNLLIHQVVGVAVQVDWIWISLASTKPRIVTRIVVERLLSDGRRHYGMTEGRYYILYVCRHLLTHPFHSQRSVQWGGRRNTTATQRTKLVEKRQRLTKARCSPIHWNTWLCILYPSLFSTLLRNSQPFWFSINTFKKDYSKIQQILSIFLFQIPCMCSIITILSDTC